MTSIVENKTNTYLIALEGIDGAGKSTLAPLISEKLQIQLGKTLPLIKKSIDYEDTYTCSHLKNLKYIIWDEEKPNIDILGGEHWALLIASWYSVLEKRLLSQVENSFVSDGWYFRNIAKSLEEHVDINENWMFSLFDLVRTPDVVVLLDIDPNIAFQRGRDFDSRECGMRAIGGDSDFVTFQSKVYKRLYSMASRFGWLVIKINENQTAEEIADVITEKILIHLK